MISRPWPPSTTNVTIRFLLAFLLINLTAPPLANTRDLCLSWPLRCLNWILMFSPGSLSLFSSRSGCLLCGLGSCRGCEGLLKRVCKQTWRIWVSRRCVFWPARCWRRSVKASGETEEQGLMPAFAVPKVNYKSIELWRKPAFSDRHTAVALQTVNSTAALECLF